MLCGSAKGVEWGGRHQTIVFQVAVSFLEVCVQKGFARFASLSHTYSAATCGSCPPQQVSILGHAPSPSTSFRLAQLLSSHTFFRTKNPKNLILVFLPTYTSYEDGTE